MSDQNSEDTKSPFARRGARPFVGPAGGSGAARPPLFKPAAPPPRVASTPALPPRPALGARLPTPVASPAPVAPAPVAPSLVASPIAVEAQPASALGSPVVQQIEAATVPVEAALPVPVLRPATPAQTFDITIPAPMAATEASAAEPIAEAVPDGPDHWSGAVTPAYTPTFQSVIDEVPPADDVMSSLGQPPADAAMASLDVPPSDEVVSALEAPQTETVDAPEPPVTRPITSDMVAIDAFEAFETVWDAAPEATPQEESLPSTAEEPVAASPLDDEPLGSGIDAQQLWGDEITQDTGDYQAYQPATEVEPPHAGGDEAPIEAGWASRTTPELPMPAWLSDDAANGPADLFDDQAPESDPMADDLPPAPHEATMSSVIGTVPNGSPWSDPRMAAYAAFVTSPDGVPAITNAIANDKQLRGLQVSAALERLAERIRDGEIDVSSVAPEAPDAAMLASVLAALLGGSNSR